MLHGGELKSISDKYNIPIEEIIDFSGNISPVSISNNLKDIIYNNIEVINSYPDKNYYNLRKSISDYCNCDINNIVVGNGATEIISLLINNLNPKESVLVAPVYSEYKKELKNINCEIIEFELRENENFDLNIKRLLETTTENTELLVICNPNNPTGNAINIKQIESLLQKCKFLMIDETYVEFSNSDIESVSLAKKYKNLFVIRGMSKFFGIPGIRLGYGICSNKEIVNKINKNKELWSVNSFADLIGQEAFKDKEYINNTRELVISEREYVIKELNKLNKLKIYKSQSNFILCKILDNTNINSNINPNINSTELFEKLIKEKILIRDAKNFEFLDNRFFRFCILSKENNNLLLENLKEIFK